MRSHSSKVAIDYALEVGIKNIAPRVQALASKIRAELDTLSGIRPVDPGNHLSAIVTAHITKEGWEAEPFKRALQAKGINTSLIYREGARMDLEPQGIDWVSRISVHYYNTEDDIQALTEALKELLA